MDLHGVDLVVLSACETGLGDVLSGEGVRGLQRSFRVAGVDTVVMSLWRVEDQAALEWMRVFYEHRIRDDRSLADSIYASTLESLERRRSIDGNDHPAFWGLFVASGNWR